MAGGNLDFYFLPNSFPVASLLCQDLRPPTFTPRRAAWTPLVTPATPTRLDKWGKGGLAKSVGVPLVIVDTPARR